MKNKEDKIITNFFDNFISLAEKRLIDKKLTKAKLAETVGVSAAYITQIFNNKKIPTLNIFLMIALALDINIYVEKEK